MSGHGRLMSRISLSLSPSHIRLTRLEPVDVFDETVLVDTLSRKRSPRLDLVAEARYVNAPLRLDCVASRPLSLSLSLVGLIHRTRQKVVSPWTETDASLKMPGVRDEL